MYKKQFEALTYGQIKDLSHEFLVCPIPNGMPKEGTREYYLLQFALWYGDKKMNKSLRDRI